tara:strand:+ start:567 stop:668 length:102 start_codon:yes stop_codon:yes gene_type:complete
MKDVTELIVYGVSTTLLIIAAIWAVCYMLMAGL